MNLHNSRSERFRARVAQVYDAEEGLVLPPVSEEARANRARIEDALGDLAGDPTALYASTVRAAGADRKESIGFVIASALVCHVTRRSRSPASLTRPSSRRLAAPRQRSSPPEQTAPLTFREWPGAAGLLRSWLWTKLLGDSNRGSLAMALRCATMSAMNERGRAGPSLVILPLVGALLWLGGVLYDYLLVLLVVATVGLVLVVVAILLEDRSLRRTEVQGRSGSHRLDPSSDTPLRIRVKEWGEAFDVCGADYRSA
jgi:hypothetical protein